MTTTIQVHEELGPLFHLCTRASSLVMQIGPAGHLEQVWWADRLPEDGTALAGLLGRRDDLPGHVTAHGRSAESVYSLGNTPLAWSVHGKGDLRAPALRLVENQVLDLTYVGHRVIEGAVAAPGLPTAQAEPESHTLEVTLRDDVVGIECQLLFTVFGHSGAITRRAVVTNLSRHPITLDHAASLLVDLPNPGLDVITFDSRWASESHPFRTGLGTHQVVTESFSGSSNTKHSPGFLLVEATADQDHGQCWGFNLVYSGSHHSSIEADVSGHVRVTSGINPAGFSWALGPGESFHCPEAVMVFSSGGLNGVAQCFHRFVNDCIVPTYWRSRPRPVVLNSWEGAYFDVDADAMVEMAAAAKPLGVETFVLDDGWFGERHDDRRALGDWTVNTEKLPGGLGALAGRINSLGMDFGIWVEPEAVSSDSDLFRAHPDWAVTVPGRVPSEGRFELLLDLTRPEVRDHLVEAVTAILDGANISFVKWDFNRVISDADSPAFHHRYVLGLYDVLRRIFGPRPHILLENCASGGGRFDLGTLTFGPQTWASDCTDPVERLQIQRGLGYLYPQSTISAHVSASPNHQTGRPSPLAFRCDVSAPFIFGIELDPRRLDDADRETLTRTIEWYQQHRGLIQFGDMFWNERPTHLPQLAIVTDNLALSATYETHVRPFEPRGRLRVPGLTGELAELTPAAGGATTVVPVAALRHGLQRPGRALDLHSELVVVHTR